MKGLLPTKEVAGKMWSNQKPSELEELGMASERLSLVVSKHTVLLVVEAKSMPLTCAHVSSVAHIPEGSYMVCYDRDARITVMPLVPVWHWAVPKLGERRLLCNLSPRVLRRAPCNPAKVWGMTVIYPLLITGEVKPYTWLLVCTLRGSVCFQCETGRLQD